MSKIRSIRIAVAFLVVSAAVSVRADVFNMPSGQTSLQFVTVGDSGNASDPSTGYGSVGYAYQMGEYDVTVGQYCQFLNAVATSGDPYGLYNSWMVAYFSSCKITQNGTSGSYSYAVAGSASGRYDMPIFAVTWGDAARFCNWLQNGQPAGPEGSGTTETGAYTLSGATAVEALMPVNRNTGAEYFIPSEDEWYKAAYYKGGGTNAGYWLYPTQSNAAPSNVLSSTGTNNANFYISTYCDPTNRLTVVGAFTGTPGPYGTYDMGGDVFQWNEANSSGFRGERGGSFGSGHWNQLASTTRYYEDPRSESAGTGFRVAASEVVPEPGSIALLLAGGFGLAAFAWRNRRLAA